MTAENGSILLESRKPPSVVYMQVASLALCFTSNNMNCIIFRLTSVIVCFSLISAVFPCLNFNHSPLLSHREMGN